MTDQRRVALITGASEGIGRELAFVFAAHGHDLALTARRGDLLDAVADALVRDGRPRPLLYVCDLAQQNGPRRLAATLAAAGAAVETLVNNAGFGASGAFEDNALDDSLGMIDLNVRALVELTALFLPQIRACGGGVLNVASIAAFAPGPGMAVYYASKAFVLSFSEALHAELGGAARVSALCPGPVATGFQARAGLPTKGDLGPTALSARATAEAAYRGYMAGRRVIVPGRGNQVLSALLAYFPHRLLLPALAARNRGRAASVASHDGVADRDCVGTRR